MGWLSEGRALRSGAERRARGARGGPLRSLRPGTLRPCPSVSGGRLSLCPLPSALFCDYYNPEGECEWHYQPCGAPCLRTCRNPSGRCLHDTRGLEGGPLPCGPGGGCPGSLGWTLPGLSRCLCGHSPVLPVVSWARPGAGDREAVGVQGDSGLSGPQAATPGAHPRPPPSTRTRCGVWPRARHRPAESRASRTSRARWSPPTGTASPGM